MDNVECVRVAVNIRPLITSELMIGCTDCITVVPGQPQVQIGTHAFTYDFVYGSGASPSSSVFDDCVAPLVDALFSGYNATVLAYGQTGSGKTYTMGTNYSGEGVNNGIIPKVMESIFQRVEGTKDSTEFLIRVSFIEIFKEEVFDLLDQNSSACVRGEGANTTKHVAPVRAPIQIRETVNGGITLAGVTEAEVKTKQEMASYLSFGSLSRATGSTNMNSQSSRSHAIFTITMEQKKIANSSKEINNDDIGDDILCAKLHLVDLAGSERAKRTGADGMRLKEGIHINKGLLALGNVISALGDEKKRREGGHVPYRDSKLTRLLQDSLGGNSKTVMIACVSPADTNAEETLNTLKYANRARNIQNKAIVNRDPMATQMQRMRSQIEQLQTELLFYRGDGSSPFDELQILKHKVSLLEASNADLHRELQERRVTCEHLTQRTINAQVEKDKLLMQIEAARNGKTWDEIESNANQDFDVLKNHVSRIQELEGELLRLKNVPNLKRRRFVDCSGSDDGLLHAKLESLPSLNELSSDSGSKVVDIFDEVDDEEKELEHSSLQERLDMELKELDKKLEQKEAEMKRFTSSDTSVLKQHYEKKVHELEQEKRSLQKEIEELRHNLASISSDSEDGAQKLKEDYLKKLTLLETQVADLKKKQDAQAQLLRQKQKSDEAAKRLNDEIQRIKTHKVQLQQKIKQESEQFRLWKASREKEVLQLKKEGRRNEYEMHKLLALNQRQKMVLQRKTEEAAMATKRLKELLESRKASSRETLGGNGPGVQALMQAIEHELEVTLRVHEVRSEYERQIEERARMAKEIAKLKEEAEIVKQNSISDSSMSPGARNSRIFALENMLATSSSTLVSMASQLSEAEERERGFSGRGRWNQVRSLPEAKSVMNYLFNLASSARCRLRDKEVDYREKDSEIRDLKEKVVKLSTLARHLEMQKAELIRQLKSQSMAYEEHKYKLRNLGYRNSIMVMEDMDTSEDEDGADDDDWVQSDVDMGDEESARPKKRPNKKKRASRTDSETFQLDAPDEVVAVKVESEACCTCSKASLCKTSKCQCRNAKGICGPSCGCNPNKCSNREVAVAKPEAENADSCSGSDELEKNDLASQGAKLLQNALIEKDSATNDNDGAKRKPLSDIGNTVAKSSNTAKPNRRKKWGTIQLVPVATEKAEPPPRANNTSVGEGEPAPGVKLPRAMQSSKSSSEDVPVKLPRAMLSAAAASNSSAFLKERNADKSKELTTHKESTVHPPPSRSPAQPPRTAEEKENYGH